jgi:hypothetical protein
MDLESENFTIEERKLLLETFAISFVLSVVASIVYLVWMRGSLLE